MLALRQSPNPLCAILERHATNNKQIKNRLMKYTLIILTLLLSKFTFGQTNKFSDIVNYYNTEKNFNGAVLVATNGHIDYVNGIGLSNRQSDITINSKSKFKICSITKTFTAIMVLQLM